MAGPMRRSRVMLVDARTIPDGTCVDVDVCIIGAGPAGITMALELSGGGQRVALLESGPLRPEPSSESLSCGEVTARDYFPLETTRRRCLGGTSELWAGECRPLAAEDFERHSWVDGSGWPFAIDVLRPYYDRARALCQLGPLPFEVEDWSALGVGVLPFGEGPVRTSALHYSAPTRFGPRYRRELERSPNVTTYLRAPVTELETSHPATTVVAARVDRLGGGAFRVRARRFVLAAGGLENPRLLLLSDQVEPAGLGNRHDLVGRHFMEHLYLDDAAELRPVSQSIGAFYTDRRTVEGHPVRAVLDLAPAVRAQERISNVSAVLTPPGVGELLWMPPAISGPQARLHAARRAIRLRGWRALRRLRPADPARVAVKQVVEQAPNPDSRVVLAPTLDPLGRRQLELRWHLSSLDLRTVERSNAVLHQAFDRIGVPFTSRLDADGQWTERLRGARHHMGTTRMHVDPRQGVVDPNGRVHGIDNLYVAGSSVFPTVGAANPTFTIVALALRLADHLGR